MQSSYEKNNYAEIFYEIVTAFRPVNAIELGVLYGYSTLAIAKALKRNSIMAGIRGKLDAYDLFDDYQYNHGNKKEVEIMLRNETVDDYVNLYKDDAFRVHERYVDNSIHFLHTDLSNTGEIVRRIMENWHRKIIIGGIILFEGGSEERDNFGWMLSFKKSPIKPEIEQNEIINRNYVYGTYLEFPSLTILLKKRE